MYNSNSPSRGDTHSCCSCSQLLRLSLTCKWSLLLSPTGLLTLSPTCPGWPWEKIHQYRVLLVWDAESSYLNTAILLLVLGFWQNHEVKAFSAWITDWSLIVTLWNVITKQITSGLQIIQLPLKLTNYTKTVHVQTLQTQITITPYILTFYFPILPTSLKNKMCNVTSRLTLSSTEFSISLPADYVITQGVIICYKQLKTSE